MQNPDNNELEVIIRQSEILAKSSIIPKDFKSNQGNIVAAALLGRSFGWDAMTSMRMFTVIQGTATLKPEAQLALIRQAGHNVEFIVHDDGKGVTATGTRADNGDVASTSFTLADAERAGLLRNGTWKSYPLDMCTWRAVTRLSRQLFSDVVLGAGYTPEEIALSRGQDVVVERTGEITERDYEAEALASTDVDEVRGIYADAQKAMQGDDVLAAIAEHGKKLAEAPAEGSDEVSEDEVSDEAPEADAA